MLNLKRGDVVWVNLDPTIGGEIKKRRPCVVVSLSALNEKRLTVIVIPLSSAGTPRPPLVIAVPSLDPHSNARIDQIRTVDKMRIGETLCTLTRAEMAEIEQALRIVLGV
jgi:mRNA interferase MazF